MAELYPVEIWPTDAAISRLDGITDDPTGLPYIAKGTGPTSDPPLAVQYNRHQHRLKQVLAPWNQGRVVDEGAGNIGVFPIRYWMNGLMQSFDGAAAVGIPSIGTWMVFIDADGLLQVNSNWPQATSSYLPLAEVTLANGILTITDSRPFAAFRVGYDASVWPFATNLQLTIGPETSNTIDLTIRAVDPANHARAGLFEVHAWLSDATTGAPTATAPDGGVITTTGVLLATEVTAKRWRLVTAANGTAVLRITHSAARSWYLHAQLTGRITTSGEIRFV